MVKATLRQPILLLFAWNRRNSTRGNLHTLKDPQLQPTQPASFLARFPNPDFKLDGSLLLPKAYKPPVSNGLSFWEITAPQLWNLSGRRMKVIAAGK